MAKKKPVDEESWCLSLEDLAVLLDGCLDELSKEGAATVRQVVAGLVAGSGRFDDQIAALRAMKDAAGCESLGDGLLAHRELDRLLAADDWAHPADVLDVDPEDVVYSQLIRVATVRAAQAADPAKILQVQRRLGEAQAAAEAESRLFERFMAYLLGLDPNVAKDRLIRLAAQYRHRSRQTGTPSHDGREV
jgi:hypothetical protein